VNNPFVFRADSAKKILLVNFISITLALLITKRICDNTIIEKIKPISKLLLLVLAIFFFSLKTCMFFQYQKSSTKKSKNVVLFVMDGLSTSFIKEYNPDASLSIGDISSDFVIFENIRTNYTHTYGYFDALFSGQKSSKKSRQNNLLSLLQQNEVNTCWMSAHGNAVPDNHAITNYKGFRSYFFNYRFSWLFKLLGFDYNLYRTPFEKDGYLIYLAHNLIDYCSGKKSDFSNEVISEIKRLQNDRRPFFFLIHEFPACETSRPNKLWETREIKNLRDGISEDIKKNDFYYTKEEEWLVKEWEEEELANAKAGFACIKKILARLKTNQLDDDTLFILTADHGKIFKSGKVWYGFHNDEEVARVPLVVFNSALKKRNACLGETIDITQTLLENFDVGQKINPNAFSLLTPCQKDNATTLTEYSKVRREQFLNFYKKTTDGIHKFVLDPGKKDFYYEYNLSGSQEIFLNKITLADSPLLNEFKNIFSEYGIQ
jgi:hypothetical protein